MTAKRTSLLLALFLAAACGTKGGNQATAGTTGGTGGGTATTSGTTSGSTGGTTSGTTGTTATTGSTTGTTTGTTTGATTGTPGNPVKTAKTTTIPACTVYVDAAFAGTANGSVAAPYATIGAAVDAASNGAIICVAQGTYSEALAPGMKYFTLAGGFQTGQSFTVRDSSVYVTKAQGNGTNIFLNYFDEGPNDGQVTAVDGFEITGYKQGIVRDIYYRTTFNVTNNYIHDNDCNEGFAAGAAFYLRNVVTTISGNVLTNNVCGRGAGGALWDALDTGEATVTDNLVQGNVGNQMSTDPAPSPLSHGGGLYLASHSLTVADNLFIDNEANGWGGGLWIGSLTGEPTIVTATLAWNVYRGNKAGIYGGGFFCDDSAICNSDHEIYDGNCGGNVFFDSGYDDAYPTVGNFDHMTNYGALDTDCAGPGPGVIIIQGGSTAADAYSFTNSIFWGNQTDGDFSASCTEACNALSIGVTYSLVQTSFQNQGTTITFGAGNVASTDPLFVDPANGDFHLKSQNGHWTDTGYVNDAVDSPALAAGDPASSTSANPAQAGDVTELGTYGNSEQASYVE